MEKSKFKDELRARVTDFAVTHYLIGLPENKTNASKKKQAEEAYLKLENWIIGHSEVMDEIPTNSDLPEINSEDQQIMDF